MLRRVMMLMLWALAAATPAWAQQRAVPADDNIIQLSFAPLVRQAAPAVVNIYAQRVVQQRINNPFLNDPFFRRFFGNQLPGGVQERVSRSLGSGVIVRADGLVVTNHHVIEGADQIRVVLQDKFEYDAELLRSDQRTDLAVLRLRNTNGRQFASIPLRPSDDLEVGDLVLAIGNPFGVGQTVTSGIVSALARTSVGISDFNFFIQTDAAINPGNSGGALLSMDGHLVGINTAIYSRDGGSMGIGFAVPSEMVSTVLRAADGGGPVARAWLGAEGQPVTSEIAASLDLDRPAGVLVNSLHPKGPAARAGLRVGDVIVSLAGRAVDDPASLKYRMAIQPPGSSVPLELSRNGRLVRINIAAETPPEDPPRQQTQITGETPLAGLTLINMSPAVADEQGLAIDLQGALVTAVNSNSIAARLGFRVGDVVLGVNGEKTPTINQLDRTTKRIRGTWQFSLLRDGNTITLTVRS